MVIPLAFGTTVADYDVRRESVEAWCVMSSEIPEVEQVFTRSDSLGTNALLWLVGGVAMVGVAAVGFCLAVFTRGGLALLHLGATLPSILAVSAFILNNRA